MTSPPRTDDSRPTPLEAILRRLRSASGFPTLASTITDINRVVGSDLHSNRQLTQVILSDAALTTKLLQVVNSAIYSQFHGRIRTISKAVMILGCDEVSNTATALAMLEFTRGRPQEKSLQDELIGAFFAGVISKKLGQKLGMPNSEEAVMCAMFQSLGRLLVTFFLFEEQQQIRALIDKGMPDEAAADRVLGISYRDLGVGMAREWNFPVRLIEGMQTLSTREIVPPDTDVQRLKLAANYANDLYNLALRTPPAGKGAALLAVSKRYGAAVKLDTRELADIVEQSLKEMAERSATLDLPAANSPTLKAIRTWSGSPPISIDLAEDEPTLDPLTQHVDAMDDKEEATTADTPQQVLSAGIRDVTEALTADCPLNDLLHMVLETMYRGMGFSRTMIFIRDGKLNQMRARFGFGADIERIIPQCCFPLAFAPDAFHVSVEKGADIVIENAQAENIAQRIPEWHRRAIRARSFILLPVVLKGNTLGLLYADSERPDGIKIDADQLGLLRTLRNQVALAFKTAR
ncbi:HDOD domain-containing protein [Steroidobacter sp.]|uniref:HDOD domain-containing protein n=1 Tax=Steroidobacter sp. TaxID=1978227 RepID=UPI001A38DB01|nr:HDOD domain-containing protein [Steroidobacter sp.]MBL8271203.1 HDOD domain-containing protein [Steroidobacter sp.]